MQATEPKLKYPMLWKLMGVCLLGIVIYSSLTHHPIQVIEVSYFDKVAHTLAYFALMGWFVQIYTRKASRLLLALAFIGLGIGLEVLQGLGGVRYFEYADMLANTLGVIIAVGLLKTRFPNILRYLEQRFSGFKQAGG